MVVRHKVAVAGFVVACLVSAWAEGAQYDRYGRPVEPGYVPLVVGPLPGTPWRGVFDFGAELPIGVDAVAIRRGLGPAFRMVLPGVGAPGRLVDLVVENVRSERVALGGSGAPPGSVVYTGTVRGRPDAVVVLSVVNDVLYSRLGLGDETWVVYSDLRGRAVVRLERRPAAGLTAPLPPRRAPGAPNLGRGGPRVPGGIGRPAPPVRSSRSSAGG